MVQRLYIVSPAPKIKKMEANFSKLWSALYNHGSSKKSREATERYWSSLSPREQEVAFRTITSKLEEGKFVQFDPIRAIRENIRPVNQDPTILSFDEYYARFGTTEERDGWHMENPTGQKVIYVK